MDTAKVFMTGRSQAVRLPKAYRFDTKEVSIEKHADGAVVLRPKLQGRLGDRIWAILDGLPDHPTFIRPDQGTVHPVFSLDSTRLTRTLWVYQSWSPWNSK